MEYWIERSAKAQAALTNKSIKETEKQLKKYYGRAMKRVISDFEATYNKLLATVEEPTPADLYKLDKYWQMQGQLRQQLQRLGDRQISLLSKQFELNFFEVYYSIAIPDMEAFNTIDSEMVTQMINHIWVADGKSFSQRIWENNEMLAATLNDELISCITTGKKTTELKKVLQERFNVSYSRADTLARTELAHIQTEAAKERYKDYGIDKVQIWADEDERRCPDCGKLHKKIYPAGANVPIPRHPNCRCCIVPVVE